MSRSRFLASSQVNIDQRREAVLETVPNVPDERAMVETLAVLLEEFVAQPGFQGFAGAVGVGQQLVEDGGFPTAGLDGFPGVDQQRQQALVGGFFAAHRGQAGDAVVVNVVGECFAPGDPGAGFVGELHLLLPSPTGRGVGGEGAFSRPAIAQQAGDSDLQRVNRGLRVTVKNPLGRVVGVGLRQAVGIAFGGDLLPVGEVEGDFDEGRSW